MPAVFAFRIDPKRDYGLLPGLVDRANRAINTDVIAEQWDRVQFYVSLGESS